MRNIVKIGLTVCLILGLSGCFESNQKYQLETEFKFKSDWTEISTEKTLINSETNDYFFIRTPNGESFNYTLGKFNKQGAYSFLLAIDSSIIVTNCSYVYFNNTWFIPNEQKSKCSKEDANNEVKRIINVINEFISSSDLNKQKSWDKNN